MTSPVQLSVETTLTLRDFGVVARAGTHEFKTAPLSFSVAPAEVVFVQGSIGSGKSLFAQALSGLLLAGAHAVGACAPAPSAHRVALVPQDPRLVVLPSDTLSTLRGGRTPSRLRETQEFFEALAALGVDGDRLRHVPFRHFAAGERKRVLLALALSSSPSLVVVDGWNEAQSPWEKASTFALVERMRHSGLPFVLTGRTLPPEVPDGWSVHSLDPPKTRGRPVPLIRTVQEGERRQTRLNLLELRNVRVSPGRAGTDRPESGFEAISGVSFYLREGGSLAILGASGSGKSLLLEAIFGIGRHRTGRILFGGHDVPISISRASRFRKEMQLVFQDATAILDGRKTVRRHLLDAFNIARDPSTAAATPEDWVSRLGLPPRLLDLPADCLSAGEAARVALARSLIPKPRLLLLDAPRALGLAGDDGMLWATLERERARGMALLVATSDPKTALSLCEDVAFLSRGCIAEIGPASSVLEAPAHPATRDYLAAYREWGPASRKVRGCFYTEQCGEREVGQCSALRPRLDRLVLDEELGQRRAACHFPLQGTLAERTNRTSR